MRADDAARAVGISKSMLYRYEGGAFEPSMEMLERLAELYDVPVGAFFSEPKINPLLRRFLTSPVGQELTLRERAWLLSAPAPSRASHKYYQHLLTYVRTGEFPPPQLTEDEERERRLSRRAFSSAVRSAKK